MKKVWCDRFIALAEHVAGWSKDPSTKVGAVIIDPITNIVVGMGYNGFPRGVNDSPERLNDRPVKYKMVVHAEVNAILNSSKAVRDCVMLTTYPPCAECCKFIIQSGIKAVISKPPTNDRWLDSYEITKVMCQEGGVSLVTLGTDDADYRFIN